MHLWAKLENLKSLQNQTFLTFFSFFKQKDLSKNFGEALNRFHLLVQDSLGFSFFKLFVYDVRKVNLICMLARV